MVKHVWDEYLKQEKKVYKDLLSKKQQVVEGKATDIAESFGMSDVYMAAFLDGIHEAVDTLPQVDEIVAETEIKLEIDFRRLYKQMVEYKAKDLYSLPEWDDILSPDEQKELYAEQKKSRTIIKGDKIGRNDPCSCGSGKKYKRCCGAA